MRGFVVDRSREHRFSARRLGRMGEACLDDAIGVGPLAKGASHVGTVSKPRAPDHQGALSRLFIIWGVGVVGGVGRIVAG